MEAKTAREFFEKVLSTKFKPEKAKYIDTVVQVNLTGDNPSDWVITIREQKIQVRQGMTAEAVLTLKTTENTFLDLLKGKISIEKAFFSGKINFKGDITTALKLKEAGFL
jgi:putative sterol carrier protein